MTILRLLSPINQKMNQDGSKLKGEPNRTDAIPAEILKTQRSQERACGSADKVLRFIRKTIENYKEILIFFEKGVTKAPFSSLL